MLPRAVFQMLCISVAFLFFISLIDAELVGFLLNISLFLMLFIPLACINFELCSFLKL